MLGHKKLGKPIGRTISTMADKEMCFLPLSQEKEGGGIQVLVERWKRIWTWNNPTLS